MIDFEIEYRKYNDGTKDLIFNIPLFVYSQKYSIPKLFFKMLTKKLSILRHNKGYRSSKFNLKLIE